MGEVAGLFVQCLLGFHAATVCVHCPTRACQGRCQEWPSAWGALQHSFWRVSATHVQCVGSNCEVACAQPVRGQCFLVRGPQASLQWRLGVRGVSGIFALMFLCVCVTGIFAATHLGLVGCAAGRQDFWREAQSSLRGQKKTEKHCNSKKAFTGV